MKRLTILLVIILLFLGFFFITRPGKVVITETGKVTGMFNKARASLQGDKFWRDQLRKASAEYTKSLVPQPPSSSELRELYQKMRDDQKALDARMASLYSPGEQLANSMRVRADSIERVEKWNSLDLEGEKEKVIATDRITKIVLVIESRLHIDKSQSVIK